MRKKLINLIYFVLLSGLFLTSPAIGANSTLVGWWKLDGGADVALDYSGNGNNGRLMGDPQWVPGIFGCALEFDGDDCVNLGNASSLNFGTNSWSVAAWIKTTMTGMSESSKGTVFAKGGDQTGGIRFTLAINEVWKGRITLTVDDNGEKIQATASDKVDDDIWHHIVGIRDGTALCVYIDGQLDGINSVPAWYNLSGARQHNAYIGAITDHAVGVLQKYFRDGLIDDVRLYKKALTQEEIEQVMAGISPGVASGPSPASCQINVPADVVLSWMPGEFASSVNGHKFYLSKNFNEVNDGVDGIILSEPNYVPPQPLDFGKTYYWRVDEIGGPPNYTVYEGDIWNFKVAESLSNALDTNLDFTTGGRAKWFAQTETLYYGEGAAQSGNISDDQNSWIQTTVNGTGTLKFYWKVSSEQDCDFLEFYIDGLLKSRISGLSQWRQKTYSITGPGFHVFEWRYIKDGSGDSNEDCGWVDKVEWLSSA